MSGSNTPYSGSILADPVWGDPPSASGDASKWDGWLTAHSKVFDTGVDNLKAKLEKALKALSDKPDDPKALADYQTALAQYNMYRMLQSNSVKSLGDQSKSVIRNLA